MSIILQLGQEFSGKGRRKAARTSLLFGHWVSAVLLACAQSLEMFCRDAWKVIAFAVMVGMMRIQLMIQSILLL